MSYLSLEILQEDEKSGRQVASLEQLMASTPSTPLTVHQHKHIHPEESLMNQEVGVLIDDHIVEMLSPACL